MKIVIFKGGLGNQLFQYSLYCKLKEAGYKVQAIDCCQKSHNGFEVLKYFDADISFCNSFWKFLFFKLCGLPKKLRQMLIIDEKHYAEHFYSLFYNDYWQDKRFMPHFCDIAFKHFQLTPRNLEVFCQITSTNSVAVHIRRGDYIQKGFSDIFINLSETDYYHNAIKMINSHLANPYFFIFSNDVDWCKSNLSLPNSVYVDWNKGSDSIYDFYLMSQCKVNIIANSTFSFWAAYLNRNAEMVICPTRWFTYGIPEIFPDTWIKVDCSAT